MGLCEKDAFAEGTRKAQILAELSATTDWGGDTMTLFIILELTRKSSAISLQAAERCSSS